MMFRAAFLFLPILLLLAGCEHKTVQPGEVQLNVMMSSDTTGDWHRLFEEFHTNNPGIRVNLIEGPTATNSREDQYVTSFLSGQTSYDLVYADVAWIAKFAAAGWLEDLSDRWTADEWNRFIPGALAGGTYKGRIYRVPTEMHGGLLYYRKDLLDAAGLKPPETFEELVNDCRQIKKPDGILGFVWQGKQYEGLSCFFLEVLKGFGGTWIDEKTGEVGLDQPAAINALTFLKNCLNDWKITPPGVTTYTEEEARQLFQAGHSVFMRNWPYVWPISQVPESPVYGKIGFTVMPHAPGCKPAATLGGWGFSIVKTSSHKEEAWKFLKFATSLEQIKKFNKSMGLQPALKASYEQSDDPVVKAVYKVLLNAVPRPMIPQYAQASDILQRYVSEALTGRSTPEDAMRHAAYETRLLLGRK